MPLIVSELPGVGRLGPVMMVPVAEQSVAIGASSTQSAAFNARTRVLRLHATAACHVAIGPNPTATTSKFRLAVDGEAFFEVQSGDKVAVIQG